MILYVKHLSGGVTIINDACDHDLSDILDAMKIYHRRWLRRRKPHVVTVVTGAGQHVLLVRDITSVRCVIQ
jgi:hypothetical protein